MINEILLDDIHEFHEQYKKIVNKKIRNNESKY